ncbi:MAG: Flp pilus assembly protein CpaB [Alphaproteobacteria bacterium]|nr:Flp pilus assembly protein CpaB [Alphaproteobacteria bacterium]
MSARLIILLLVAAIAAGGAGLAANSWLATQRAALASQQRTAPVIESNEVRVLVAKQALPSGTLIKENQLRWQAWPSSGLSDTYMKEGDVTPEDLAGTVVRVGIAVGEPVSETRVVRPGESGFLAAVLRPGFRAMSVPVNATTGIAGFVFPGDRVDLLLTHKLVPLEKEVNGVKQRDIRVSETVLTDIRVLAIDQSTNDQAEEPDPSKTVTIEITPKQVEIVSLIMDLGRLSLSLRSLQADEGMIVADGDPTAEENINPVLARLIGDEKPERGEGLTLDSEVSTLLESPTSKRNVRKVQVVRGGESAVLEFQR